MQSRFNLYKRRNSPVPQLKRATCAAVPPLPPRCWVGPLDRKWMSCRECAAGPHPLSGSPPFFFPLLLLQLNTVLLFQLSAEPLMAEGSFLSPTLNAHSPRTSLFQGLLRLRKHEAMKYYATGPKCLRPQVVVQGTAFSPPQDFVLKCGRDLNKVKA